MPPRALFALLMLALAGCDGRPGLFPETERIDPCLATDRSYRVSVLKPDGTPALDLRAQSVVLTTGKLLRLVQGSEDGTYLVAGDSDQAEFEDGSRIVRFTATSADLLATADFVFDFDGCDVLKVSGPTQISAQFRGL